MPKKISTETIEQAKQLKLKGKNNQEIHSILGVSVAWCKKHLVGIKCEAFDELYAKSKRKQGLSKAEIVQDMNLSELDQKDFSIAMQKTVRRVRANHKDNVVRPNWMHPNYSLFVTDRVLSAALATEERIHEEANELHWLLTQVCSEEELKLVPTEKQIKAAMLGIASASVAQRKEGTNKLNSWLKSLTDTSTLLAKRNGSIDVDGFACKEYTGITLEDLEDCMY